MADRSLSSRPGAIDHRRAVALRAALERVLDHSAGHVWHIAAAALSDDDELRASIWGKATQRDIERGEELAREHGWE